MRFYNVRKLIAYRQTPLPSVCPAFYPHTNVCLFVPVASYDHLSVRPRISPSVFSCIHVWPSVCPTFYPHVTVCTCIRMWSSVCPTLYPHVTICYLLYPYMTLCLSLSLYPHVTVCLCFRVRSSLCPSFYPHIATVNLTFLSPMKKDIWGSMYAWVSTDNADRLRNIFARLT